MSPASSPINFRLLSHYAHQMPELWREPSTFFGVARDRQNPIDLTKLAAEILTSLLPQDAST